MDGIATVKLTPNRRKILESILFLIKAGEDPGPPLTQYQIVKSLFVADTAHLGKYGRPITFDNYSALEFGPVPREAYDMLKEEYPWQRVTGEAGAPWQRKQVSARAYQHHSPTRDPDLRQLSKTDLEELTAALQIVRDLGFGGVRDWTHEHPAYIAAWENRGSAKAKPMDYALLLPNPSEEEAEALAYASAHA